MGAVGLAGDLPLSGAEVALKAGLALVAVGILVVAVVRDRRGDSGPALPPAAGVVGALAVGVAVLSG